MSLNKIVIMGRFTKDPEIRRTQSDTAVASFTLAVDRDYAPKGGEKQTDFIDCVAWRQTAEFIGKYFWRGMPAVVTGELNSRHWTDKENNKRTSWEINVDKIYFAGEKKDRNATVPADRYEDPFYAADGSDNPNPYAGFSDYDGDEDLPY